MSLENEALLDEIGTNMENIKNGEIVLKIHDGKLAYVEVTKKFKPNLNFDLKGMLRRCLKK